MPAVQSREPGPSGTSVSGGPVVPGVVRAKDIIIHIRHGRSQRSGAERGAAGNKLGDGHYGKFAETPGVDGWLVTDPEDMGSALRRGQGVQQAALANVWADPDAYLRCPLACQP